MTDRLRPMTSSTSLLSVEPHRARARVILTICEAAGTSWDCLTREQQAALGRFASEAVESGLSLITAAVQRGTVEKHGRTAL